MKLLDNKVALVTGAAKGIGAAIAEAFVREGAFVCVTDVDADAARDVAERLGDQAEALGLDVAKPTDWMRAEESVRARFGGLDILVNNAGIIGLLETPGPHDPEHFDLESWRTVQAVNVEGAALGCRSAIRLMRDQPAGSIINLSSRSGIVGIPGAPAYAASKAAVLNHTRSVALYCAEQGYPIRCNAILPAAIMTPMWDAMLGTGEGREAAIAGVEAGIPMGRFGRAKEVADAAVFLASDKSSYMTGSDIHLDGGILAGAQARPERAED
jgi:NAD(P)-dependent dehydrogenase (short-subunit alcohol dehydrogenase family)